MSVLTAISEVKNLPRTLFGFFRKAKGEGLNSTSADRVRKELSDMISAGTHTATELERVENSLKFHIFSHIYIDKRLAEIEDNHFFDWLNKPDAYLVDPNRAYSFLTLLAPFNLLASSTRSYLLAPAPVLWGEESFVIQFFNLAISYNSLLKANGKTMLSFMKDVVESLKSFHLGFWSFHKKADNLLANLNIDEMSIENKREACAAILTVASRRVNDKPKFERTPEMLEMLSELINELKLDRLDVSMAAVSLQLAGQWAKSGCSPNGFGFATNKVGSDPFKYIHLDLPTLTDKEVMVLSQAKTSHYLANLLTTFGIYKEFRSKHPGSVDRMLYTSLLDFREFPSQYKKHVRANEATEQFLEQCVVQYITIHTKELREKLLASMESSGIKLNKAYMSSKLSHPYNDSEFDLKVLDNSEIAKYIFDAYSIYLGATIEKYYTVMDGAKDFIEMISPVFIVDISSIKKIDRIDENTRVKYTDSNGRTREKWLSFTPLELKFDFSDEDKKKLFERILERQDMPSEEVIRAVQKYTNVCIVQKIINKVMDSKKNEIKFNLRDLDFGFGEETNGARA